jgi:hypothetical protein
MALDDEQNQSSLSAVIETFVTLWSLDNASEELLHSLPEGLLKEVVETFDPPPDTRNKDAKLKVFIRTKKSESGGGQAGKPAQVAPPSFDRIREFAEKWQLDDDSQSMLHSLSSEDLEGILTSFSPPADTQNVNARLISFVRSRKKRAVEQEMDHITGFVRHWGLDQSSEALLRSLSFAHLEAVMEEFNPPMDTLNISGKLTSYVRSVERRMQEGGYRRQAPHAHSQPPRKHFAPEDLVTAFVKHWGIDAAAEEAVRQLPAHLQESVINGFNPPPNTLNASGKLTAFIRTVAKQDGGSAPSRKRPLADPILEFTSHWQLDGEAEQILRSLPWDKAEDVMNSFQPPPDTRNYSARFHTFARSRLAALENGKGKSKGDSGPPRVSRDKIASSWDSAISDFIAQWGLDEASDNLLRSLPEDMQEQVLLGFEPEVGTRNPNAKLATWVRSLRNGGLPPLKAPRR